MAEKLDVHDFARISFGAMFNRQSKVWFFVLEGMGSLSCGFYGNYIFFLLRDRYAFGNLGNLGVSALQGLVWAVAAWQGGRFAQRHGCFTAIRLGLIGMTVSLVGGSLFPALAVQLAVLVGWTASMCLIWPALEALVSEGETQESLPRMLGGYNILWATCSAVSYFIGGAIFEHLGSKSIFILPIGVYVLQLVLLGWLARGYRQVATTVSPPLPSSLNPTPGEKPVRILYARTFLRMAWLANPFACVAINTLLAMIPALARDLHLSTTVSGLFCSIWFFGRLAGFILLSRWKGWHYQLRWLLGAFLGLLGGFSTLLMAHQIWLLALAQVVFGFSVGLIYYSSLFYSMDVGETKAEHGGLHEAFMGCGNFVGPATGAAGLLLAPQITHASAYAVSALLALGLAGMVGLWLRRVNAKSPASEASQGGE